MRLTQLSGVCLMGVAVLAHADDDWLVVKKPLQRQGNCH
jgi:sigma-E factor negative regulatory protein RseB